MVESIDKLVKCDVKDDSVFVTSSHTTYSNQVRASMPTMEEVKSALKLAKARIKGTNVKILNQKKAMDFLESISDEAYVEYDAYNHLFDQYVSIWKDFGLTDVITDDVLTVLDESVYDLRNEIDSKLYRNTKLSQFIDQANRVIKVSEDVLNYKDSSSCKIYL